MPSINIPKSAYPAIQSLIHFKPADFDIFLEALSKAEPSLDQDDFWRHVAKHVKQVDPTVIEAILHEIFEIDDARLRAANDGLELEDFVEAITEAVSSVKSKDFQFGEAESKILKDRLLRIFAGRKGLDITTKAMGVAVDHGHIFLHARIMTDIRPVFNKKGDSVDAAVIVHNLRIHYAVDSDHKDFYVALDTSDIQSLRENLDRADTKAKCLQGLLKTSGVSYLDAEE
jgi:hypothetical protein